jgi:hypothetical protein
MTINSAIRAALGSAGFVGVHRFDSNETAFLERELTQLRARVFEVIYPDRLARSFLPMATDIAPSADTYSFKVTNRVGRAKIIANGVTDIPRVDVNAFEVTGKVRTIGASYGWTVYELREAARIGTPLETMKAMSARDAVEDTIDEMLFRGDVTSVGQSNVGVTGLVNNTAVETLGVVPLTHWVQATAAATMLQELNTWVAGVVNQSFQKLLPDTMLLPPSRYNVIAQKAFSADNEKTVLRAFLENNPYIKNVAQWHRLENAGASGKDRGLVYRRDPIVLEGVVPQEFEQHPPQAQGLELVINTTARCGGVKVYQPLGMLYGDFADS